MMHTKHPHHRRRFFSPRTALFCLVGIAVIAGLAYFSGTIAGLFRANVPTPVAHWKFDEGTGTTAEDRSENRIDATLNGGATWKSDELCVSGGCMAFDGANDSVIANSEDYLNLSTGLSTGFTFATWVKVHSLGEGNAGQIFHKDNDTYMRVTAGSSSDVADLEASLGLTNSDATTTVTDGITLGRWHHVAMSYTNDSQDEIYVYIDGVLRGQSTNGDGDPIENGGTGIPDYPVVEATATSAQTTSSTTHTVTLPSGITSGDLLVIFIRAGGNSVTINTPTGWTLLTSRSSSGRTSIFYRVADGTEGATRTITTSSSRFSAHNSYRISGVNTSAPISGGFTGSTSINPPNSAPGWGELRILWLAMANTRRTDNTLTQPSAYSSPIEATSIGSSSTSTNHIRLRTARRNLEASSEDPATFTSTGTLSAQHAATVAINPAVPPPVDYLDFTMGGSTAANFHGMLDEFKVYDVGLTAEQIKAEFNALGNNRGTTARFGQDSPDFADGLLAYWKFDERTAGNDAQEANGKAPEMINANLSTFTNGKFGNAANFSSSSSQFMFGRWNQGTASTISASALTSGSGSSTSSLNTASVSPASNRLVLLFVGHWRTGGSIVQPTVSGNGLTWVAERTIVGASNNDRATLFRAMGSSPTSGVVTISFGGQTQSGVVYSMFQMQNANTIGLNGSTAIRQTVTGGDESSEFATVDLASFSDSTNNATIKFTFDDASSATVESGFTQIHNAYYSGISTGLRSAWRLGQDLDPTVDYGGATPLWYMIAGEVRPDRTYSDTVATNAVSFWVNPATTTQPLIRLGSNGDISLSGGSVSTSNLTNVQIYVNGVLNGTVASGTWSHILVNYDTLSFAEFTVGRVGSSYMNGSIDELKFFNRPFDQAYIEKQFKKVPGPVGHWKLDDNGGTEAVDSSSFEHTGTLVNTPAWIAGQYGSALRFNGSNTRVTIDGTDLLSPRSFTVSAYINPRTMPGAGNYRTVVAKDTSTNSNYHLEINGTNAFNCGFHNGTGYTNHDVAGYIQTGRWQHVACVFDDDGNTMRAYYNGARVYSGSETGTPLQTATSVWIGARQSGTTRFFDGGIDDVRIYNYARDPELVIEDANAGHPAIGTPLGSTLLHLSLDEGYGATANDKSAFATNGTITGGSWNTDGAMNRAYRIAAVTDRISMGDIATVDGLPGLTISFWIRPATLATSRHIIGKWPSAQNSNSFLVRTNASASDELDIFIASGTSDTSNYFTTTNLDLATDVWQQVIVSYSGGEAASNRVRVYKNGEPRSGSVTGTIPTALTSGTTSSLIVGDVRQNSTALDASYDEVKIYGYALSAEQAKVETNFGKASLLGALTTQSDGTTPSRSSRREHCVPGSTETCNDPLADWRMDEGSGTSVNDMFGGNTGTLGAGGSAPTWVAGRYGRGLQFDGTDDQVSFGSPSSMQFTHNTSFTISAWIKINAHKDTNTIIFRQRSGGSSAFGMEGTSTGTVRMFMRRNDGTQYNATSAVLSVGRWYHIVGVHNDSLDRVVIYVDGRYDAHATFSQTIDAINGTLLVGTKTSTSADSFNGSIDHVKIYDYVRSQSQVAWEYNQGQPQVHYKFDECTGTTLRNSAVYGNGTPITAYDSVLTIGTSGTQTSIGSCDTAASTGWYNGREGKWNYSMNFDGTDDRGDSPNAGFIADDNYTYTQVSFGAWVNPNSTPTSDTVFYKNLEFRLMTDGSGRPECEIYSGSWQPAAVGTTVLPAGEWSHIMCVYDGQNLMTYVNGALETSILETDVITSDTATDLDIARDSSSANYWSGRIDDLRIYAIALTPPLISSIYSNGALHFR